MKWRCLQFPAVILAPAASFLASGYIPIPSPLLSSRGPHRLLLLLPTLTPMPSPHYSLYPPSFPPSASLSSSLPRATPRLQSHPDFQDKENTEDQFCSVTFAGGLQSKGMAGEAELREIYWGRLRGEREREERFLLPDLWRQGTRRGGTGREEEGREEKIREEKRRGGIK